MKNQYQTVVGYEIDTCDGKYGAWLDLACGHRVFRRGAGRGINEPIIGTQRARCDDCTAGLAISRCERCRGPHQFDTSVPSVLWNRVVRPLGWGDYLCTMCIVKAFAQAGVSFTATLSGDGFHGLPILVEINGAASTAPRELEEQNNELRWALRMISDAATQTLTSVQRPQVDERGEGGTSLLAPRLSIETRGAKSL